MLQLRGWLHPGSLAVGLLAGVAAAFLLSASIRPAVADTTTDTESAAAVITYSAGMLTAIVPSNVKEKVEEVIAFPTRPVFLVRTVSSVTVWERRNGALVNLLEIALDSEFKSATFLDDNKTFIIHTKKSAAVFTVDRNVFVPKEKK